MSEMEQLSVAIVDYGMGNLFSVKHACENVGLEARVTAVPEEILNADAVILPGVGAFGNAMNNLRTLGLVKTLRDYIESGKLFLGICLGMQLLMSTSEEFGEHEGLCIFDGKVSKFPKKNQKDQKLKVPQVGWNTINKCNGNAKSWDGTLLEGIEEGEFMYFVHSFYVAPANNEICFTTTSYEGIDYCSGLVRKNVYALQFHPEKSAEKGILVYKNLAKLIHDTKRS